MTGPGLACVSTSRANEEIAQVRSKAQAEALALQASLRKAQLQIQSLEKTVEQKVGHRDPKACSGAGFDSGVPGHYLSGSPGPAFSFLVSFSA